MKRILLVNLLLIVTGVLKAQIPTPGNIQSLIVPTHMAGGDTTRMPVYFKLRIIGLNSGSQYKYATRLISAADFSNTSAMPGAGISNYVRHNGKWRTEANPVVNLVSGANDTLSATNAGEYEGWFSVVNNGDSRFTAGNVLYPVIVLTEVGGSGVLMKYYSEDSITVLNFGTSTSGNFCTGVYGMSLGKAKEFVAIYEDFSFARPVSIGAIENSGVTISNQANFYVKNVRGVNGAWGCIFPNYATTGIRKIERYSGTGLAPLIIQRDTNGIFLTGTNTKTATGGLNNPFYLKVNDAPLLLPLVTFQQDSINVSENAGTIKIPITRKYSVEDSVFYTVTSVDGTAMNGVQFNYTNTSFSLAAGLERTDTITFTLNNDTIPNTNKFFTLSLTNLFGATAYEKKNLKIKIIEDDFAKLTFNKTKVVIKENAGNVTFRVKIAMSAPSTTKVMVAVKYKSSGTAIPAKFNIAGKADSLLTFSGAKQFDSISLVGTIVDNFIINNNDTIVFALRNINGQSIAGADSIFTLIIEDNDKPPVVSFDKRNIVVSETDASVKVRLNLAGGNNLASDVILRINTSLTTAQQGVHYTYSPTSKIFTIDPSDPDSIIVNIPLSDDEVFNVNRKIVFQLTALNNITIGSPDTLTITVVNDDLPIYTAQKVKTVNTNGVADSLGVKCRVRGIVHSGNYRGNSGLQFYLVDATGGVAIFSPITTFGYTPAEGDSVTVVGRIDQVAGNVQIGLLDTIYFHTSGNNLKPAQVTTVINESTESNFIKLNKVRLVNPSEWPSAPLAVNSTKTVEVTNESVTFSLVIDSETNIDGTTAPTGYFNLSGFGYQTDNTNPYTDNYHILPRRLNDFEMIVTPIFNFSPSVIIAKENTDSTPLITITAGQVDKNVLIQVYIKGGTAQRPGDYQFTSPMLLTFTPGETQKTFKIKLTDDAIKDSTKTILLAIRDNSSGTLIGQDSVLTVNILDNETTSIAKLAKNSYSIYPNPATNKIIVETMEPIESLRIFDLTGKEVIVPYITDNNASSLNLESLINGLYYIEVRTTNGIAFESISIIR